MPQQMYSARTRLSLVVLAFIALLCAWLLARPFIHTIILACVVAALSWPLHARVRRHVRNPSLAAACTLLILVLGALLLFMVFFSVLVPQAIRLAGIASSLYTGEGTAQTPDRVAVIVDQLIVRLQAGLDQVSDALGISLGSLQDLNFSVQLRRLGSMLGQRILHSATALAGEFAYIVAHTILLFFILYFFLRDGRSMLAFLARLSPLTSEQGVRIARALRAVAKSVFVGGGLVALCQGALAGVGFAVVGLPALVLGLCCVLASFVPMIGTALVWAPAAVYLYAANELWQAIFIALWGLIVVSSSDSILRALFMRGGTDMPILLLFLAIMGGFSMFGVLGLLYGPLMLTFTGVVLTMYAEYAAQTRQSPGTAPRRAGRKRQYWRQLPKRRRG